MPVAAMNSLVPSMNYVDLTANLGPKLLNNGERRKRYGLVCYGVVIQVW